MKTVGFGLGNSNTQPQSRAPAPNGNHSSGHLWQFFWRCHRPLTSFFNENYSV